jgi:hypothetical protein
MVSSLARQSIFRPHWLLEFFTPAGLEHKLPKLIQSHGFLRPYKSFLGKKYIHVSFLKLCISRFYWINTEKVDIRYYAPAVRTALNSRVFLCSLLHYPRSIFHQTTKDSKLPRSESLKGCLRPYLSRNQ